MRILKWPLIVAAVVVVLRVVVERLGAPDSVSNIFSAVVLHFLIVPVYIAIRLGIDGSPRPYGALIKLVALYVVLTRVMILPTYWLGRFYDWPQRRFGGLAGATPFTAYFTIPFATASIWILSSIVFGGILGCILIAILRRFVVGPSRVYEGDIS